MCASLHRLRAGASGWRGVARLRASVPGVSDVGSAAEPAVCRLSVSVIQEDMNDHESPFETHLSRVRSQLAGLRPEVVSAMDETLELTPMEVAAWQDLQARAHAAGLLSQEESQWLRRTIGQSGRWPDDVDLPSKVVATHVVYSLARWSPLTRRG